MKKNRFSWLPLLAIAAFVGFPSCQRDAEPLTVKPLSDVPVDSRSCTGDVCSCTVTADADAVFDLCGDLPPFTSACTACGSTKTGTTGAEFPEDAPRTFCIAKNGNLCITNLSFVNSVGVTVQFGTSTPVSVTIGPGQTHCFHSDSNCNTFDGCL